MDMQQYLRLASPLNVLDVLELPILDNFLNGYSFALGSGICVVYPSVPKITLETLDRRDARDTEASRTFRPLCAYWRAENGCNQDQHCIDADKCEVFKYIDRTQSKPKLYCCTPLGLWDMTFPLRIESNIIGVLFGGQIVVNDTTVNWKQELKEYDEFIDWATCPDGKTHIEHIKTKIENQKIPEHQKTSLNHFMSDKSTGYESISVEDLKKRFGDFLKFGKITQELLDELHKARKTAAEQQLLRDYDEKLETLDLTNSAFWWEECGRLLDDLTELPGITAVRLYRRARSRYVCEVPVRQGAEIIRRLPTRDVIPVFPAAQLVSVKKDIAANFGFKHDNIWGYRSQTGAGSESCSTLVIFQGTIPDERRRFIADLCKEVCIATDFALLFFRERDVDRQYRLKVDLIGHSIRTPLQILQFDLEQLAETPLIAETAELQKKISNGMERIRDAREDVQLLLESDDQAVEVFNFVDVVAYVLGSMESIAQNHPCVIVKQGTWLGNILVRGNRYRVQRALTCLLDNAIKYSFYTQRRDGGGLYEVRVWFAVEDGYTKVTMRNYGIGIPEAKLANLREYGLRGNVPDKRKRRLGTGLGLPFAIDVFEESGGWIHITSIPAISATEEERKTYLRYITTVEAAMPIWKEN
ncbi:MAG: PocR ligand-binding domain-containing protein [Anaerolineae bacterium]|nr:PocR ligand-binding domain-containing protein [Anaerolineae bacterium]